MTPERARSVRESWSRIAPRADEIFAAFYRQLFELDPEVRGLFGGADMAAQRRKFSDTIGTMVGSLDDLARLISGAAALGRRHAAYGVRDRDYETAGVALLGAFAEVLGDHFSADEWEAWTEAYRLLAGIMRRASARGAAASPAGPNVGTSNPWLHTPPR